MDPQLAARFAKQKVKEQQGDELEVAEIGSAANLERLEKQLDPVLAKRWAKQKEREETGDVAVEEVGSVAFKTTTVDPFLAKRWSRLQEEGVPVHEIGSAATVTRQLDPVLAKAFEKSRDEGSPVKEIGSAASVSRQFDPVLAKAFAKQQQQQEQQQQQQLEEVVDDAGAAAGQTQGIDAAAERVHLSIKAGATYTHTLAWPSTARSIRWGAVALDDLTIDLELSATLEPLPSGDGLKAIVLQRNARGVNFVADFAPARKRGLAAVPAPSAEGSAAATAAASAAAGAQAASDEDTAAASSASEGQRVHSIVFKFSNAFSWFTPKEVELVTLFE
mmetsp:Transcript_102584/g.288565  ORF Transcript_102584/g.288565 Transcript_102584/m.288565 type:complete len:333 (-) Transcript_102584:493-1491(-)